MDVEGLLYQLCVELGFCLEPEPREQLLRNPPSDVDDFTDAVIRAEGLEPHELRQEVREHVRVRVERAFC